MDHGPAVEYNESEEVIKYKSRIGIKLFFIYAAIYAAFVALNTVLPKSMKLHVLLGLNLARAGITYWRDIHDAPAGPLDDIIDDAMRKNPTLILVLSKNSVESDWVEDEATRARKLEKHLTL